MTRNSLGDALVADYRAAARTLRCEWTHYGGDFERTVPVSGKLIPPHRKDILLVSIDDLGFCLEDMFLITKDGSEDLTPGIPFTTDEIEAAMKTGKR